jgi:hypothetical protein
MSALDIVVLGVSTVVLHLLCQRYAVRTTATVDVTEQLIDGGLWCT